MRLKNLQRGGAGSKKKLRRGWRVSGGIPALLVAGTKKRCAGKNQKQTKQPNKKQTMKTTQLINRSIRSTGIVAFGLLSSLLTLSETAQAQVDLADALVAPTVFQAAGPTNASIQGTVDAFRTALGIVNNANNPGPLASGRREINWDGGNPAIMDTTPPVNPFNGFLNTRGARFTTLASVFPRPPPLALKRCSRIRRTAKSSERSVRRGCSPPWAATLPTRSSSSLAPTAPSRRQSRDSE